MRLIDREAFGLDYDLKEWGIETVVGGDRIFDALRVC